MKINHIKFLTIATLVLGIGVFFAFQSNLPRVKADETTEATYKRLNCHICHKADVSKLFDATKADADLEKTILEGKDAKPIKMPEFTSKGIDAAKAKELVAFMKEKA